MAEQIIEHYHLWPEVVTLSPIIVENKQKLISIASKFLQDVGYK